MIKQADMRIQGPQIHAFNNIAPQRIPRSNFQRDFPRRQTMDVDYLYPIFVDEILPGDEVKISMSAVARLTTPLKPIMDNLYMETFWFYIPNRILWPNWEKLQGQQLNPGDSVAYQVPVLDNTKAPLSTTGFPVGSLYDYLGVTPLVDGLEDISALFGRAYYQVLNDWFRDEALTDNYDFPIDDGPDDPAIYTLQKRRKRKDYLTSCLIAPQKGTAPTISLGTSAPLVVGSGTSITIPSSDFTWTNVTGGTVPGLQEAGGTPGNPLTISATGTHTNLNGVTSADSILSFGTSYADLSGASAITINTLRENALYQQILELDARGGTRYVESLYSRWGVISPDFRLQRAELIGEGRSLVNVYAVPQTGATGATGTPQGNLASFGLVKSKGEHGCHYAATEHGIILGLVNIRADLTYSQNVPRMFTRRSRLDFYEPLLNGLGEQAVLNREIYAQGTSDDKDVFGYQERFAEYRFKQAEICGLFRPAVPSNLAIWHLSENFGALPGLDDTFIQPNTPMNRVVAVTTEPKFYMDAAFSYSHTRAMPIRSNPGIDVL